MNLIEVPNRKILILIIIISSLLPINVLSGFLNEPIEMSYAHGTDGLVWMAAMKSYLWGYVDPFGSGTNNMFENPWMGSVYFLMFLGAFTMIIDAAIVFHIATFIFSILFLIASYNVILLFVEKKYLDPAFLFYLFVTGSVSWIVYMFFNQIIDVIAPGALGHLVWAAGMAPATVFYWSSSLAFGYFAFIVFVKRSDIKSILLSSVLLAISVNIYPLFGMMLLFLFLVYSAIHRKLKKYLLILPLVIIAIFPWLYFKSDFYTAYLSYPSLANLYVFIFHGILLLPFALYFSYKILKKIRTVDKNLLFLVLWGVIITGAAIIPQDLVNYTAQKFIYMKWLPISIMAFLGIQYFLRDKSKIKNFLKVITILIIITIPSIGLWYFDVFVSGNDGYFPKHESDALLFLRNEPQGNILASYYLSLRSPYLAQKRALHGGGPGFEEASGEPIKKDYETFYSNDATIENRERILEKYNIRYVIFGAREKEVSEGSFNPDSLPFLEEIYSSETRIYIVNLSP